MEGSGGFASTTDATSAAVAGEVGLQIARNVTVVADVGRFGNVQPSTVQPTVDTTVATLAARTLNVLGLAHVPAWYAAGGLRIGIPTSKV